MDIENLTRELLHEPGREQAHVSGETDQVHIMLLERINNFAIMLFARFTLRWNYERMQAALARRGDTWCIGFVGDDDSNARSDDSARVDAVGDGNEIRAASGKENAKGMHC